MGGLPRAGLDSFLPADGAFYLYADVGRLNNKLFGFFALVDGSVRSTEVGVEAILVPSGHIRAMAAEGEIAIAANVGLLYLAGYHPQVRTICSELGFSHPPWMDG